MTAGEGEVEGVDADVANSVQKSVKKVLTKLDSCGILTELSAREQLKPLTDDP